MKSPFLTSLSPSERRRSVKPCPRCRYINKDPRALFCKMCRADLQKRDPRRARILFGLLGLGIFALILLRTNALNYALDKLENVSFNVSQKVDTTTRLPQDTYVPTVIGPANSNQMVVPTPAPQTNQAAATQSSSQSSTPTANTPQNNTAQPSATSFLAASSTGSASSKSETPAEHLATAAAISHIPDASAAALQKAIDHLKAVPPDAPQYAESQELLKRLELQAKRGQPQADPPDKQARSRSRTSRKQSRKRPQ